MSDIKTAYGTSNISITCSIAGLTANAFRSSASQDNSSNKFLDALVSVKVSTLAGPTATAYCALYAYGSVDGGTTFTDQATGADASMTPTVPTNLRLIGQLATPSTSMSYRGGPFSVAAAFGGTLPSHWGVVFENKSGGTLDGDSADHSITYQGIYNTVA